MKPLVDRIDRANREIRQALFWMLFVLLMLLLFSPRVEGTLALLGTVSGIISICCSFIWGWYYLDDLNDSIRALKSQVDKAETNR